jgi:hypothetical protein
MPKHIPQFLLVPVGLAAWVWILSWVIAEVSGWRGLAAFYANDTPFEAGEWRFTQAALRRWVLMRSSVTLWVGADRQFLYLRTWPFSLPGFRELRVPWQDVTCRESKSLFWKLCSLRFRAKNDIEIQISQKAMESIITSAAGRWANGQPQFPT